MALILPPKVCRRLALRTAMGRDRRIADRPEAGGVPLRGAKNCRRGLSRMTTTGLLAIQSSLRMTAFQNAKVCN